jgi:energy-coupling factor transport system ATP-binding protein
MIGTTVEEEVAFGLENLGVPTDKMRTQVNQTLTQMQMQNDAKRSTYQLSGGQKQNVSIASTLAMRPNCIVLDEATAMLEPTGRAEVMESILELNRNYGITIILITHYMDEAALSDYIYVMQDGMIVKEGIPQAVFLETELLESIGLDIPVATKIARALKARGLISKADILTEEALVTEVLQALKKERGD